MFNKLLSNLPFNPSLIDQVAFYSSRLKKEAVVRRVGFAFIAITMLLQIFAVVKPTEASNQCSSNDVIRCGFKTKQQAVDRCNSNAQGFRTIIEYYGISCATLAGASTQTIGATAQDNQLYSMGRNPYQKRGEYATNIPGAGTFYLRPLSSWGNTSYKMLVMKTSDNQTFMVMYDCGNIVIKGGYTPPARPEPASSLKLAKINQPTGIVKPGDYIDYTLAFTNTGGTSAFFAVNDTLPTQLEYISSEYGNWIFERNGSTLKWVNNTPPFYTFGNTEAFGTPGFIKIKTKVKQNTPSGTTVCNAGWLTDVNTTTSKVQRWSDVSVCNTVVVDCPAGTLPGPNGTCIPVKVTDAACAYLKIYKQPTRTKFSFEAKANVVNGATISSYTYDFGDGSKTEVNKSNKLTNTSSEHEYKKDGTYTVQATIGSSVGAKQSLICKVSITVKPEQNPTPVLSISKGAKNITKGINDANNTVANAGDVIEYSLTTTNLGDKSANNTVLRSESLADVLEYSNLDLNSLGGATFEDTSKTLSWNTPVTIQPGAKITKTFKVAVKDPIPQTLKPYNQPGGSYDMVMTNVYGNTVNIKLPSSLVKTTEQITTTLPNTGPGSALLIGAGITIIIGYFYARSRLLSKELDIVRSEYATTSGGM